MVSPSVAVHQAEGLAMTCPRCESSALVIDADGPFCLACGHRIKPMPSRGWSDPVTAKGGGSVAGWHYRKEAK